MQIDFDATKLMRPLNGIRGGLQDGSELMGLIGEEMTDSTDDRFRDEVDPDGSPWAALNPKYVEWKIKRRFIPKRLQMRGDMRAKVTYQAFGDRVVIGSDTPYSGRQHEKRPFLYNFQGELGSDDDKRVEAVAIEYFEDLAKG